MIGFDLSRNNELIVYDAQPWTDNCGFVANKLRHRESMTKNLKTFTYNVDGDQEKHIGVVIDSFDDRFGVLPTVFDLLNHLVNGRVDEFMKDYKAHWSVNMLVELERIIDYLVITVKTPFIGVKDVNYLNTNRGDVMALRFIAIAREVPGFRCQAMWKDWFGDFHLRQCTNIKSSIYNAQTFMNRISKDSAVVKAAQHPDSDVFCSFVEAFSAIFGKQYHVVDISDEQIIKQLNFGHRAQVTVCGSSRAVKYGSKDGMYLIGKLTEKLGIVADIPNRGKTTRFKDLCTAVEKDGFDAGLGCGRETYADTRLCQPLCEKHLNERADFHITVTLRADDNTMDWKIPCLKPMMTILFGDYQRFVNMNIEVNEPQTVHILTRLLSPLCMTEVLQCTAEALKIFELFFPETDPTEMFMERLRNHTDYHRLNARLMAESIDKYSEASRFLADTFDYANTVDFVMYASVKVLAMATTTNIFPLITRKQDVISQVGHIIFTNRYYATVTHKKGHYYVTGPQHFSIGLTGSGTKLCVFHKGCERRLFTPDGIVWGCQFPIDPACKGELIELDPPENCCDCESDAPKKTYQVSCTCDSDYKKLIHA